MSKFRFRKTSGSADYEVLWQANVIGAISKYERRYNLRQQIVVRGWIAHNPDDRRLPAYEAGCYRTREDAAEGLLDHPSNRSRA